MPLPTDNRAHYSADEAAAWYAYTAPWRLQLIAYLRALNAYRAMLATLFIREQLPTSDVARVAHVRALDDYARALMRLPSWCAPPSYVAHGM